MSSISTSTNRNSIRLQAISADLKPVIVNNHKKPSRLASLFKNLFWTSSADRERPIALISVIDRSTKISLWHDLYRNIIHYCDATDFSFCQKNSGRADQQNVSPSLDAIIQFFTFYNATLQAQVLSPKKFDEKKWKEKIDSSEREICKNSLDQIELKDLNKLLFFIKKHKNIDIYTYEIMKNAVEAKRDEIFKNMGSQEREEHEQLACLAHSAKKIVDHKEALEKFRLFLSDKNPNYMVYLRIIQAISTLDSQSRRSYNRVFEGEGVLANFAKLQEGDEIRCLYSQEWPFIKIDQYSTLKDQCLEILNKEFFITAVTDLKRSFMMSPGYYQLCSELKIPYCF
ncbi:MAG: hypothetical protein QRY74_02945 [Chlamydia sp.]